MDGCTIDAAARLFIEKMERAKQPKAAIDIFLRYYDMLRHGKTGCIAEDEIVPVAAGDIDDLMQIGDSHSSAGAKALPHTVVIKLNGGLGTSMGLYTAKSLIPVKNELSFLDITALQIRDFNERFGVSIPLILMNSFNTDADSLAALLGTYRDIATSIPLSFIQHKFPKIRAADLKPAEAPDNPPSEWNPPGHGDLYTSILSSGVLDKLIDKGYRYAFISNCDNLGALLDTWILGYFAEKGFPFLMEVTDRTYMDRKGGHIARLKNGSLVLREAAQCPPDSIGKFMDTSLHRYFNTNNLWIRLDALKDMWRRKTLNLPMIRNMKKLDPRVPGSPDVIQLESAMGSAISVFENAGALRVPRTRFAPVKNCEELLLLWSDYYVLTADYRIVMSPRHKSIQMNVNLDPKYYRILDDLKERFPSGIPSLAGCESLSITGDVKFGKGIIITGKTSIVNTSGTQALIPDGTRLTGEIKLS
ncbi:MAG: UTP--glucose-1-phosphate uridylyltransferase [Chitinispirillia bacterium]|nr:UTP--glucose-1-phosphate uridylyltransferase [Chitinispirillia bacterium]MCL2240957.1 UTP--glucose-1-phosphate uridylyltransferase [Chitinispirillia bacterium]